MKGVALPDVAAAYLRAVHDLVPAHAGVAAALGCSLSAAAARIQQARRAGLLPASAAGRAVPPDGDHWPRMARFSNAVDWWPACTACHHPWPCPDPATLRWLDRLERTDR